MEITTFYAKRRQYIFHSGYNKMDTFEKKPSEKRPIEFNFTADLPENEVIKANQSAIVTAADKNGTDVTSTIIEGIECVDDVTVRCVLKAGTLNEDYMITFAPLTDPHSYVIYGKVLLQIREETL